ncbi:DNA adenine methylase [Bdellovibrio sp. HCB185ZH]|uniref:DNA adenine methylase n=1 Tax=Bdellovibrio sp. HCB185ZH TaxID=3394235 RepID=UPI0039A47C25
MASTFRTSKSVQLSPFRYPGGKSWLCHFACEWTNLIAQKPDIFIEPFCGGGSVGLFIAANEFANEVLLVEKDPHIAAVWKTILSSDCIWLVDQILEFRMNQKNINEIVHTKFQKTRELAFQTILKNRISRSGIIAHGAGRVKIGEEGRGLSSRWYPETLAHRIANINSLKKSITFKQGDAYEIIPKFKNKKRSAMYIDPPYISEANSAGKRLYNHWDINFSELIDHLESYSGNYLLSYENSTVAKKSLISNQIPHFSFSVPTGTNLVKSEIIASSSFTKNYFLKDLSFV